MRFDVMVATRQYEAHGEKKTYWTKVGSLFTNAQGQPSGIELDVVPTRTVDRDGNPGAWDGRLQVFMPREQGGGQAAPKPQAPQEPNDEIPF